MIQHKDGSEWPEWITHQLDLNPTDSTARGVWADWLDDHDQDPILAACMRFMAIAPKWPARRSLSPDPNNLCVGYGWFTAGSSVSVPPTALWPSRDIRPRQRWWVWPTRRLAEDWFVERWRSVTDEVRYSLTELSNVNSARYG